MSWAALDELDFDVIGSDESLALGALEQVGRVTARADVGVLSDDELLLGVGQVERARRWVEATEAHLLAELDARGLTDERRGLRTGQWIALETHEPVGAVNQRVSLAVRLRTEFPVVDQALSEGRIGWAHVGVLVRACNERIAAQFLGKVPWLIGLAAELPFEPWKQEVWAIARRLDADGGYDPETDPEASKLFLDGLSGDDIVLLRGVFVGDTGRTVTEIIEERTDQLWARFRRDNKASKGAIRIPRRPDLRAMALVELVLEARAVDPTKSKAPVTDLTVVLRIDLTDMFPAGEERLPEGLTPGGMFTGGADLQELFASGRFNTTRFPDTYETFDGCRTCGTALEHRLCDAAITFLLTNTDGVPLDLGRTIRFANDDQRRAVKARDGGCVFPGCDRHVNWCDIHHVDPWEHGGETSIDNLACLCRFHHGVTHRRGWTMHTTGNGWFTWTTPTATPSTPNDNEPDPTPTPP